GLHPERRAAPLPRHPARLRRPRDRPRGPRLGARGPLPDRDRREHEGHGPVRPGGARGLRRARGRHGVVRADLRGDRAGLDGRRRHPRQPLGVLLDARPPRHRRAARPLPARPRDGGDAHRHRADRARRRHRPAGHHHDSDARRWRVRRPRHQDVDHQRPPRRRPAGAGQDRPGGEPGPPRHEHAADRRRHARARGHQGHGQARLQGHRVVRGGARRRAGPRERAARRRRGTRAAAGAVVAGDRPDQHRRPLGGHRAARLRRGPVVRPRPDGVRPADRRLPGRAAAPGRDRGAAPGRPAHDVLGGVADGRRRAHGHRVGHGEDLRVGDRAAVRHRRHAHPRRLRLLDGVRGRAALPRRPADVDRRGHQRRAALGGSEVVAGREGIDRV
ncbi:MAG: Acyl-CoA dehydrogenase, partial [uncultured Actinomycetospora sp.]